MSDSQSQNPFPSQIPSLESLPTELDRASSEESSTTAPLLSLAETEKWMQEALQFKDLYLRTLADLDNYRKRVIREKEEAARYANASLMEALLPVLDNFELGLEAAARPNSDRDSLLQGMNMVQRQLMDFLVSTGVEVIDARQAFFDPQHHEALSQEPHPELPEGQVIRQLRKGYKLKDRLLRPATVVVSQGPAGIQA